MRGTPSATWTSFQSNPNDFEDTLADDLTHDRVTHVFAGHNHADREYDFAGIPASTVLNTGSLAALLGVVQENSFDLFKLTKAVTVDNPSQVALVAEGGSATFKHVDVWTLTGSAPRAKRAE